MFTKMFFFEWRYFVKQPSFYVTSLLFFFITFFAASNDNVRIGSGGNVLINSPYAITEMIAIMGIFAMFLVVNFVANTALRNETSKMAELLYSKPIDPVRYQLGRFFGAFATTAVVFLFIPIGSLVGSFVGSMVGWIDPELMGPIKLSYYLTPFLTIALPTLFVLSCLFYAAAMGFRSMMATYLTAVAMFILYSVSGQFFSEPEYRTIVALSDPLAINTLSEVTRYWTPFEKNTSVVEMSGLLLQNRIIWMTVGFLTLLAVIYFADLRSFSSKKQKKTHKTEELATIPTFNTITVKASGNSGLLHLWLRTKFEIKQVVFSPAFLVLSVITGFSLIAPMIDPSGMYGTPDWPITKTMVQLIVGATSLLTLVILTYYSAEIVWRERNSGMGDIIDSTPVNNITFWLSKLIAMGVLTALLFASTTCITVFNQLLNGYSNIDLGQYLIRLGYAQWLPLLMTVVLAFFLQVISPNKYVGMLLFVVYIIGSLVLSNFGFSHNMFHFAEAPALQYSDVNGFGHFLTAHAWYMLYWMGFCLILATLVHGLWHRGPSRGLRSRLKTLSYYWGNPGKIAFAAGIVIVLSAGSVIHHNTRVLNDFMVDDDRYDLQVEYEKRYVEFKNSNIPITTKVNIAVDIYPQQREMKAVAKVQFENKGDVAIERFLVSKPSYSKVWNVEIDGGSLGEIEGKFDTAWFNFEQPLMPGESRSGQLTVVRRHDGFSDDSNDYSLLHNGTFINNGELLPSIGYNTSFQLTDKNERRKRGLAPLARINKLEQSEFYNQSFFGKGMDFIDFEATITTSEDQFAIAPGYLQHETVKDGRRTFHYKMDQPMVNFYSIMSADLSAKKVKHNGIDIEVYYHHSHSMNVDRMIESVKDSIDYFSQAFGPYQHKQMRIIEFPGYRTFAQSFANTVPYSENIGFVSDLRDPDNIDVVYYVTAHEVAHQWWGHQVGAADVQGSQIVIESLAQYSSLMVMEKQYGAQKLRQFLKYELDKYLRSRASERIEELPLLRSENQQYIHYEKGSVVMMAIKDRLGETRLNTGLREFLNAYQYQSTPYPTSADLLRYINQQATTEEQQFITRQFEKIELYDLKTTNVVVSARDDGKFDLTITIDAALSEADGQGKETPQHLSEMIDIGVFAADPDNLTSSDMVKYLNKHRIESGHNVITITVDESPKYVGVDPFVKLIDKDSADNIYRL